MLSVLPGEKRLPFWLILCKDLSLGVVADVPNLSETSNIELFRAKLRHSDG